MTTQKITAENAFEPENRRKYLGGTDISAILGFNPYKTAYECYLEKSGQSVEERQESDILWWGHELEPSIAKKWLLENPDWEVISENNFQIDPEFDFLACNTDREVRNKKTGEIAILECKTVASTAYKNWKLGVPITYYTQVQHYLGVKGYDRAFFAMLVMDSREMKTFEVIRDETFITEIRDGAVVFWLNTNLGVAPDKVIFDWSKDRNTEEEVVATSEQIEAFEYLKKAKILAKKIKERIEEKEEILKLALQDKSLMRGADDKVLCTWKGSDVERIDSKKLRADFPEVATQVTKTAFERKFLTK